jgi:hypothetical protein
MYSKTKQYEKKHKCLQQMKNQKEMPGFFKKKKGLMSAMLSRSIVVLFWGLLAGEDG